MENKSIKSVVKRYFQINIYLNDDDIDLNQVIETLIYMCIDD